MNCVIENIKEFNSLLALLVHFEENVKFQCDENGFTSQCLANANTCILKLDIQKDYFAEYKCENKIALALNVKLLHNILKKCTKEDKLSMASKDNILSVTISNESNMTTYDIHLVNFDQDWLQIPQLTYNLSCTISPIVLKTWKNIIELCGESMEFKPMKDNILKLTADNSGHKMQRLEKINFDVFDEPHAFRLGSKSIQMICSMLQFNKDLIMAYQNDSPIQFSFKMEHVKIESYFAPMMDVEED